MFLIHERRLTPLSTSTFDFSRPRPVPDERYTHTHTHWACAASSLNVGACSRQRTGRDTPFSWLPFRLRPPSKTLVCVWGSNWRCVSREWLRHIGATLGVLSHDLPSLRAGSLPLPLIFFLAPCFLAVVMPCLLSCWKEMMICYRLRFLYVCGCYDIPSTPPPRLVYFRVCIFHNPPPPHFPSFFVVLCA